MVEEWKAIPGYPPTYEVSNLGNVRSYARSREPRLLKLIKNSHGYSTVHIGRNNTVKVHRLVLLAFVGECPEGYECCHRDSNRQNNHLSNLYWGTRSENALDKRAVLTDPRGERHGMAKLVEDDIHEIRQLYSTGMYRQKDIGDAYGIHQVHVSDIVNRKTWSHV